MTTRETLLGWLAGRRPAAPDGLAAHLAGVVGESTGPIPDALGVTGLRLLERVAGAPRGGRELALDLLAADAFITYAFEAQAELDVDGIAQLAARVDRGEA